MENQLFFMHPIYRNGPFYYALYYGCQIRGFSKKFYWSRGMCYSLLLHTVHTEQHLPNLIIPRSS